MDNYTLESFINFCNDMQIANESKIDINKIKQRFIKLIDGFLKMIDTIRKKIISFTRNIKSDNEKYCYGPDGTNKCYNDIGRCYRNYHLPDTMRDYLDKLKKLEWDDYSLNKVEKLDRQNIVQSINTIQEKIDELKKELTSLRNQISSNNSKIININRELREADKKYNDIYDKEYKENYDRRYNNLEESIRHNRSLSSASFTAGNDSGTEKLNDEKRSTENIIEDLKYKLSDTEEELKTCTIYLEALTFIVNKNK